MLSALKPAGTSHIPELLGSPLCCLIPGLSEDPDLVLRVKILIWFFSTIIYQPVLWSQVCNSQWLPWVFGRVFRQHLGAVLDYPRDLHSALLSHLGLSQSSHLSFKSWFSKGFQEEKPTGAVSHPGYCRIPSQGMEPVLNLEFSGNFIIISMKLRE